MNDVNRMVAGALGVAVAGALLVRWYLPDVRQKEPAQVVEVPSDLEAAATVSGGPSAAPSSSPSHASALSWRLRQSR